MKVIKASLTFKDDEGDTLELLECPRQRDVERLQQLEMDDAFSQLDNLKKVMGEDAIKEIQDNALQGEVAEQPKKTYSFSLRCFMLGAIAQKLVIGGEVFGGKAILDTYEEMDPSSIAWIDSKVSEVWEKALPSDAQRED